MILININYLGSANVLRNFLPDSPVAQYRRGFARFGCLIDLPIFGHITHCFYLLRLPAFRQLSAIMNPWVSNPFYDLRASRSVPEIAEISMAYILTKVIKSHSLAA